MPKPMAGGSPRPAAKDVSVCQNPWPGDLRGLPPRMSHVLACMLQSRPSAPSHMCFIVPPPSTPSTRKQSRLWIPTGRDGSHLAVGYGESVCQNPWPGDLCCTPTIHPLDPQTEPPMDTHRKGWKPIGCGVQASAGINASVDRCLTDWLTTYPSNPLQPGPCCSWPCTRYL